MQYGLTGLISAAGLSLAILTACQSTVPVGPDMEGEGARAKSNVANPRTDGNADGANLNDSCFQGKGGPLPENCMDMAHP